MRAPLLLVLLALAGAAQAQAPLPGELVVNEIQYDPPQSPETNYEWVEVVNRSGRTLDLATVQLGDAGALVPVATTPTPLAPGAFAVLARSAAGVAEVFPGTSAITVPGFPALNNGTGDRVRLVAAGVEIDAVAYTSAWGGAGVSLERRDPDGPSTQANFASSTDPLGGTPGRANSVFAPDTTPPALAGVAALDASTLDVTFSEPVAAASAVASAFTVSGGVGPPAAVALSADRAAARLTLGVPLASPAAYTLTARGLADDRGNVLVEATAPFFFGQGTPAGPRDLVVNEFLYDEPAADNPGEYVELFNRTDRVFDLRDFTLGDNTGPPEPITAEPAFVLPGGYAVVVRDPALFAAVFGAVPASVPVVRQPTWSALNNAGDAVVLAYRGALVDSLTYTAAWGGEDAALERRDPEGPSAARANWATSTDPLGGTPGRRNSRFEPDLTGPRLLAAAPEPDGRTIVLTADEPVDPASAPASAFTAPAAITAAAVSADGLEIRLTLAGPLPAGASTLTARGLRDALSNATAEQTVEVAFTPDPVAPGIARASALSATTVEVVFTEPVRAEPAASASAYDVAGAAPASVAVVEGGGGIVRVVLALAAPLPERVAVALVARGLVDLAGNERAESGATLFFGQADTPAPGDLAITEILFDPADGSDGEYVELLNTTADRVFDLRQVVLEGDAPVVDAPVVVLPGAYVVLARDAAVVAARFPESAPVEASLSLSNAGETLTLSVDGTVIEAVAYDPAWHRPELDRATGIALERRDLRGPPSAASSWTSSLDAAGGTPGRANSVSVAGPPVDRGGLTVTSPFLPDEGQAARVAWTLRAPGGTVRVRIFDGGGRLVRELAAAQLTGTEGFADWDGRDDAGQRLRAGIYVVLVEAVDVEGGTTERYRAAVVLARR